LHQPVDLGAHGALAFWPLAAGAVIGGIELILLLRERQRAIEPPPADTGPQFAAPGQFDPGQFGSAPTPPGDTQPGQVQPGQVQPGQVQPGPIQPGPIQHRDLNGQAGRQPDWSWDQYDR
jgi:hypothetical protein